MRSVILAIAALVLLTACAPLDYAGAGYVALALALDREHAVAQEQSRVVEREIEVGR